LCSHRWVLLLLVLVFCCLVWRLSEVRSNAE
jgi:lipopolysaccharide export system protein LptC